MISAIQEHLESIYGIRCQVRVSEFLVDRAAAEELGGTGRSHEELLVRDGLEGEGDLEVALYFSPELLERLQRFSSQPPGAALEQELPAYCQLAEGVSHFLYLAHSAEQGRKVSLLELEAQAEIDKFVTCLLARWEGNVVAWSEELISRLFDRVTYNPALSSAERFRYEEANRLARGYCRRLNRQICTRRLEQLLSDLRYSYRLGAEAKLRHLNG